MSRYFNPEELKNFIYENVSKTISNITENNDDNFYYEQIRGIITLGDAMIKNVDDMIVEDLNDE